MSEPKYRILKKDGSVVELRDWQREVYPDLISLNRVSPHLSIREVDHENEFELSEVMIELFEMIRKEWGKPIRINSGWRSQAYQLELKKKGYRAAKFSPHCYGYALDLDTDSYSETFELVQLIKSLRETYLPWIRIGWKKYKGDGMTFVHIDIAPFYHRDGGIRDSKSFPSVWKYAIEW